MGDITGGGRALGNKRYGVSDQRLGTGVQDIFSRRMARLDGKSPAQSEMRENVNRQADQARARGMSAAQVHAIERAGQRGLGRDLASNERRNLGDAQSLLGNIIKGKTATEGAYGSLAAGRDVNTQTPPLNSGFLGLKVICTELHRQGLISSAVLRDEEKLGVWMSENRPWIYFGYQFLGGLYVKLMRRSIVATNVAHTLFKPFYRFVFRQKKTFIGDCLRNPVGASIFLSGVVICPLFYFPFGAVIRRRFGRIDALVTPH